MKPTKPPMADETTYPRCQAVFEDGAYRVRFDTDAGHPLDCERVAAWSRKQGRPVLDGDAFSTSGYFFS